MTRIYSHGRLNRIYSALYELRYYVGRGADFRVQNPGSSLESLERIREATPEQYQTYMRLLKDDARLANEGVHDVTFHSTTPVTPFTPLNEWLAGIEVRAKQPDEYSTTGANSAYVSEGRLIMATTETVTEALEALLPDYAVRLTAPDWVGSRYNTAIFTVRPDLIPDSARAYSDLVTEALGATSMSLGPYYEDADYPRYRTESYGIGGNGRLYSLPSTGLGTVFIDTEYLPGGNVEQAVEVARERYRQRVLSRLRNWRTNDQQQAEEAAAKAQAQAASLRRFEQFRAKVENTCIQEMLIPTLPFVEVGKGIKASRRWGIEIETGAGRDLRGVPDEWDSKGDGSLESAYEPRYVYPEDCDYSEQHDYYVTGTFTRADGTTYDREVQNPDYLDPYDCSSCGDLDEYGDNDDCVELVSPILNQMHSKGLREICEDLEDAPRTDSAGIHVHVEAKDLTIRQIKELVMGYDHIERFLESSYDRVERGYCKRRSARELLDVVRQPEEGVEPRRMRVGDRYVTVNLMSLSSHGTIEFRAMGPRYNYGHLTRWAMFCREMVNVFANGATSKLFAAAKSWEDVLAIFAKYGTEYNFATMADMERDNEFADEFEPIEETV